VLLLKTLALLGAALVWAVLGGRACDQWWESQYLQHSRTHTTQGANK
jgi:hypothetical protein